MRQQELTKILIAPVISEKSTALSEEQRKYVFKVKKAANKKIIKQAVELMFNVQVESITCSKCYGKNKTIWSKHWVRSVGKKPM